MTENNQIKNSLRVGDYHVIAEMTELSWDTVRSVLNGRRNNDLVWEAAKKLVETRKALTEQFNQQTAAHS